MFTVLDRRIRSIRHSNVMRFTNHRSRSHERECRLATHKRRIAGRGQERREATRESIFSAFWLRSSVVSVLISLISGSEAFLLHIKIKLISRGGPAGTHARSLLWAASGRRSASHCTHRGVLQTVDPFLLIQPQKQKPLFQLSPQPCWWCCGAVVLYAVRIPWA